MCSPAIAIPLLVAGAGVSAIGAAKEQKASNQALEYNAKILETNAKTRELQAINTEKIGAIKQSELKSDVNMFVGTQRSGFGASGVVVDEGSAFDAIKATEIQGTQDALTLQYNIDQEAFGYKAEAQNLRAQAKGLRNQKGSTKQAVFRSLLNSATQIGSQAAFS